MGFFYRWKRMKFAMAVPSRQRWIAMVVVLVVIASGSIFTTCRACPYSSIFSFGDSLADTGNLYFSTSHSQVHHHCFSPPYGQTYFHHPSGCCSDGRLIIDFIGCHKVLGSSLFLVGEIGGNDFNYPLFLRKSIAEIKTYVPYVINAISSAISELIDLGARTLMVPGNLPLGCNAIYLTKYETKDKKQYDPAGCLKWLNEFAEYYNHKLQTEIHRLRRLHPQTNIIYADYYNAALPLYHYPPKFGFTGLKICCGMGGPYNYNVSAGCSDPGVIACDDPSQYIGWDGIHLTEAAYRLIAQILINGSYSYSLSTSI